MLLTTCRSKHAWIPTQILSMSTQPTPRQAGWLCALHLTEGNLTFHPSKGKLM